MKRLKEDTRAQLMMAHGFAMLALGLGLFYIRGTMTNSFFDVIACAFAMLLVTGSLLFIAAVDWICAVGLALAYSNARNETSEKSVGTSM
jgi:hypothetical protein